MPATMPRPSRVIVLAAAAAAALLVVDAVSWVTVSSRDLTRSDFTSFYVGSSLLGAGRGAAIYDAALQARLQAAVVAPWRTAALPFVNPPAAAVALLPLTAVPLAAAYRLMQAAQLLMLAGATVLAARAAPWPARVTRLDRGAAVLAALAGAGTLALGLLGQWDGLSALAIAGAYALWRRDSNAAAGAVLAAGALLAKPHLALGLAALLLGWGDRRVLLGAATGATVLAILSLVAVGPAGIPGFLAAVLDDAGRWPPASMLGFAGLAGSWLGAGAAAQAVAAAASLASLALCVVLGRRLARRADLLEPALSAAAALSLLATPHLLAQDLVVLAPPFVALTAWVAARERGGVWSGGLGRATLLGWALLAAAAGLDLGAQGPAPPGRLVPWALLALAAGAARLCLGRRARPATGVAATAAAAGQGRGRGVGVSPEYS